MPSTRSRAVWFDTATFVSSIPSSELVIFERSGHLSWYEEPARFLPVIEAFLGK